MKCKPKKYKTLTSEKSIHIEKIINISFISYLLTHYTSMFTKCLLCVRCYYRQWKYRNNKD